MRSETKYIHQVISVSDTLISLFKQKDMNVPVQCIKTFSFLTEKKKKTCWRHFL